MKVLIFTQFFPPEIGATQTRLNSIAAGLAQRAHEVTVICEVPNHPQGVVHPDYSGRPVVRRRREGFRVLHVWVRTTPNKTRRSRLEFYGSYAAMATLAGCMQRKPDVILASSPPLPVAAAAATVAARHRVPWVFDVRDLWPEAAVALGELSEGRALDAADRLARRLYESAAAVTAVTEPFCHAIAGKVTRPEKVTHVPNGTTRFWIDAEGIEADRSSLDLPEDEFVWTFAGNVGAAQGLEAAVDAAAALADEGFHLVVLGDGPAKEELEARACKHGPGLVDFRPQVAPEVARRYLQASDALLVPLAADPELSTFVPSKLYDYCGVGRPVIVAAAGEPTRLSETAGAALTVPPGSADALVAALRRLRAEPELAARLARDGQAFAARNLREGHVGRLTDLLVAVADSGRGANC